ncbi:MAG: hypothetical protein Q4G22_12980 [Paracoccus sp. (in: a-proteobacteria)]|uniref:hypothetical protein n=1 Tax=Paracoccus sp. TaxID=267 RepID=UPI0026E0CB5F|nr:hypothetical protein [Paracoccus sp. (in: a-proteobacteria)]MDO5632732.1 hypothetical protein [Paracoccus sp. (in: a-proteobacteria)]
MPSETPITNFNQFMAARSYLVPTAEEKLKEFPTATMMAAKLGSPDAMPKTFAQVEPMIRSLAENTERVIRLNKDTTKTESARHEAAKVLAERVSAMARIIKDNLAHDAARMQRDAAEKMTDVLGPRDHARKREVRDWMRQTLASGDENAVATVTNIAKRDLETARAICGAGFHLCGMSEQLHGKVRASLVSQYVPEVAEMLTEAAAIESRLPNYEALVRDVHVNFYLPHLAQQAAESRVDV